MQFGRRDFAHPCIAVMASLYWAPPQESRLRNKHFQLQTALTGRSAGTRIFAFSFRQSRRPKKISATLNPADDGSSTGVYGAHTLSEAKSHSQFRAGIASTARLSGVLVFCSGFGAQTFILNIKNATALAALFKGTVPAFAHVPVRTLFSCGWSAKQWSRRADPGYRSVAKSLSNPLCSSC